MTMEVKQTGAGDQSGAAVVCTLFEGDYHFGVAALINSLVKNGFQGEIVAGYRGALPPWLDQLKPLGSNGSYQVSPGVRVEFVALNPPMYFSNFKPEFMLRLIAERPGCEYICYFDPDIMVASNWAFYARWMQCGVALCTDVNGAMPENHPRRSAWKCLVGTLGLQNPRPLNTYYNAGFVGLPTACSGFLKRWSEVIELAGANGFDLHTGGTCCYFDLFSKGDQDALNIATMYSEYELTTLGPEGMGFAPGQAAMYHAVGSPKPWRKKLLRSALLGVPPFPPDRAYLANITHPIRPHSGLAVASRRAQCAMGALIGRFYSRR